MHRVIRSAPELVCCAVVLMAGCKQKPSAAEAALATTGKAIASGLASDLRVSPEGSGAAFLMDAKKPRLEGIAPQVQIGELHFARVDGSFSRKAGEGVVNTPGGYSFSPDGKWLVFVHAYNPANHEGELAVLSTGSRDAPVRAIGKGVSYFLVSPDSKWLAYVEKGLLRVAELGREETSVDVSGEVRTAEFSPDATYLLVKRTIAANSALMMVPVGDWRKLSKLGEHVGDYAISKDGRHIAYTQRSEKIPGGADLYVAPASSGKPRRVSVGVTTGAAFVGAPFAFSADSKWLARIEGAQLSERGALVIGPASGEGGAQVALNVYQFQFSPDSAAIAYLDRWSDNKGPGHGHGSMGFAAAPDWKHQDLGDRVPNFNWGADGKHLAFISRFFRPLYSVDLMLYRVGDEAAKRIEQGVFGYDFSSDNKYLLLRTRCVREGRACELHALELSQPAAPLASSLPPDAGTPEGVRPVRILEGVYSFRTAPRDPDRVLATFARTDGALFDAMAYNVAKKQFKTLDRGIVLPALFAAQDGSKVVYVVADKARPGVYVSEAMP